MLEFRFLNFRPISLDIHYHFDRSVVTDENIPSDVAIRDQREGGFVGENRVDPRPSFPFDSFLGWTVGISAESMLPHKPNACGTSMSNPLAMSPAIAGDCCGVMLKSPHIK